MKWKGWISLLSEILEDEGSYEEIETLIYSSKD
jgi:hypothetical protein